jgi:hypothetical protein
MACGFLVSEKQHQECVLNFLLLIAVFYLLSNLLCKHLAYNQAGLSNQNHFSIFQLPVLTMMPERSQVIPSRRNGDLRINVPSWVPRKHTPRLHPRHKRDQPVPLLSRVPGPRPNLDSKLPHLRPGLNAVLRPPHIPASNQSA